MIRIEGLGKTFNPHSRNKNQVLRDVSFELPEKGLICIYGKSGSGKTTLLNIIGGLDKQDTGTVYINGEAVSNKNRDRIRNQNIGFVFQNYYLESGYTIEEIMHNAMVIAGFKDEDEIKKRSKEVLELVDMERFKHKQGDSLSGGQKQRVAIARALIKGADIIVADEPTGNLDAENTMRIMDIFKEISKTNLVVIVTHEVTLIKKYADSYIQLVDGELTNKDVIGEVFKYETEKNNIYINKNDGRALASGITGYGSPSLSPDDIQIFNKDGRLFLTVSNNITILDSESEKKIVFVDEKDKPSKDDIKAIPSFSKATSRKNGKLFKLKGIIKAIKGNDSEGIYSGANIFKQLFIISIALVMAFFSLMAFDVLRVNIDHKLINENATYLDLNTYKDIKRFNEDIYDTVDFFETKRRTGSFSYNDMTALSGIECDYAPKSIDNSDSLDLSLGRMPEGNEVLISSGLSAKLRNSFRLEELDNDKAMLLVSFEDRAITGIVNEPEPYIYMNRAEYVNFLGVYDSVQFVDPMEIFFTKDFANNTYRAEIVPMSDYEDKDPSEVELEISRNALYKMCENTKNADYLIQMANSRLRAHEGNTGLDLKSSKLYVKKMSITRESIKSDIRIYVHPKALDNIFVYLEPNIDTLTANNDGNECYFEILTNSSEQQRLLDEKLSERYIEKVDIASIYSYNANESVNEAIRSLASFLVIMVLLFFIYYFMEKSGSIKNSKEYGIYRAIGVNRSNLLFKEGIRTLMNNLISYLVAYTVIITLMSIRYVIMNVEIGMFIGLAAGVFLLSALIMLGISLIPYLFVIRETPSQILSRYDI